MIVMEDGSKGEAVSSSLMDVQRDNDLKNNPLNAATDEKSSAIATPTNSNDGDEDGLSETVRALLDKSRQRLLDAQKLVERISGEENPIQASDENDSGSGGGDDAQALVSSKPDFRDRFDGVMEKTRVVVDGDSDNDDDVGKTHSLLPKSPSELALSSASTDDDSAVVKRLRTEIKSLNEQLIRQQQATEAQQRMTEESKRNELKLQGELDTLRMEHQAAQQQAATKIDKLKQAVEHLMRNDDGDDSSDDDSSSSSSSIAMDILPTITEEPERRSSQMSEMSVVLPRASNNSEADHHHNNFEGMVAALTEQVDTLEAKVFTLELDKNSLESENEKLKEELKKMKELSLSSDSTHSTSSSTKSSSRSTNKSSSNSSRRRKQRKSSKGSSSSNKKSSISTTTSDDDEKAILEQFGDEMVKRLAEADLDRNSWNSEDIQVRTIAEAQKRRSSFFSPQLYNRSKIQVNDNDDEATSAVLKRFGDEAVKRLVEADPAGGEEKAQDIQDRAIAKAQQKKRNSTWTQMYNRSSLRSLLSDDDVKSNSNPDDDDDDEASVLEQFGDEVLRRLADDDTINSNKSWDSEDIQIRTIAEVQKRKSMFGMW